MNFRRSAVLLTALLAFCGATYFGNMIPKKYGGFGQSVATGLTQYHVAQVDNTGAITIGALPAAALPTGIDAAKINTGAVSNTEFSYLDGVTSAIQAQINARATAGVYVPILKFNITNLNSGSLWPGGAFNATTNITTFGTVGGVYVEGGRNIRLSVYPANVATSSKTFQLVASNGAANYSTTVGSMITYSTGAGSFQQTADYTVPSGGKWYSIQFGGTGTATSVHAQIDQKIE